MRIAWVSHTADLGGAERSLLEAVRGLMCLNTECHVVMPEGGPLGTLLCASGVPVHTRRYPWWMGQDDPPSLRLRRALHGLGFARHLARLLDEVRPDVVVTNTLTVAAGALAAWLRRIPHVWYIHEFGERDHGLRFDLGQALSCWAIAHLSQRVIVNSCAVRDHFARRIRSEKMRVVSYAVELPSEPTSAFPVGGPFRVVLVGRKAPGKRQEDALRAIALLRRQGLNVGLTLVGAENPEYGTFLRKLAVDLGVESHVEMVPFVDPVEHFAAADVALMCSGHEAFGRVTIEAMKAGTPVIGANSGGTPELIRDGWNGLQYRAGDPDALAHAIRRLYHDRDLLLTLGRNAMEWAQRTFTLERYASDLFDVFAEAIAAHGGRRRPCSSH